MTRKTKFIILFSSLMGIPALGIFSFWLTFWVINTDGEIRIYPNIEKQANLKIEGQNGYSILRQELEKTPYIYDSEPISWSLNNNIIDPTVPDLINNGTNLFAAMKQAAEMEHISYPTVTGYHYKLNNEIKTRDYLQLLTLSARLEANNGNHDASLTQLRTVMSFCKKLIKNPTSNISYILAARSIEETQSEIRQTIFKKGITKDQLSEYKEISKIDHDQLIISLKRAAIGEINIFNDEISSMAQLKSSFQSLADSQHQYDPLNPSPSTRLFQSGFFLRQNDTKNLFSQYYSQYLDILDLETFTQIQESKIDDSAEELLRAKRGSLLTKNKIGHISLGLTFPSFEGMASIAFKAQLSAKISEIMIAAQEYFLNTGRYPTELSELDKNYLPDGKIDPFTNTPIQHDIKTGYLYAQGESNRIIMIKNTNFYLMNGLTKEACSSLPIGITKETLQTDKTNSPQYPPL